MNDEIKNESGEGFGLPILIMSECDLLDSVKVAIKCGQCGTSFRFALENDSIKICPKCRTRYSHATLIAPSDDIDALREFIETLEPDESGETEAEISDIVDLDAETDES